MELCPLWPAIGRKGLPYCVVDALDEMDLGAKDAFLVRLNSLATYRPAAVKVLVTSRPKRYLQSSLKGSTIVHVTLEQDLVGKVISAFTLHCLNTISKASLDQEMKESFRKTICTKSEGLFLHVRLILDQLMPILQSSENIDVHSLVPKAETFEYQAARLAHPFMDYAVNNWTYHASYYDNVDAEFDTFLRDFLHPDHVDFQIWLQVIRSPKSSQLQISDKAPAITALHIAAFAGLTKYSAKLLREGTSVHEFDDDKRTPLHWAALNGHAGVASLLLQAGARPDADDRGGVKSLHNAARRNYSAIVRLLLHAGVDPLTPKTRENHDRRLMFPIIARRKRKYSHETLKLHDQKLFQMFIAMGLDPLAEDKQGRSALDVASACDQKEILKLFQ